jgi:hypothetical protein
MMDSHYDAEAARPQPPPTASKAEAEPRKAAKPAAEIRESAQPPPKQPDVPETRKPEASPAPETFAERVEPVTVAVDEPTSVAAVEAVSSSKPRKSSRASSNSIIQHHAKDEEDPGRIFQISSYQSYNPVVRKSPSMLEKIRLFSESAEAAKGQVPASRSFHSFHPLLPKTFQAGSAAARSGARDEFEFGAEKRVSVDAVIQDPIPPVAVLSKRFSAPACDGDAKEVRCVQESAKIQAPSILDKKRVYESPGAGRENGAKPDFQIPVPEFGCDVSQKKRIYENPDENYGSAQKPEAIPSLDPDLSAKKRNLEASIQFHAKPETEASRGRTALDEQSRQELTQLSDQLFLCNRAFVQCLRPGSTIPGRRKMLADCDLGTSTYRDWNLPMDVIPGANVINANGSQNRFHLSGK